MTLSHTHRSALLFTFSLLSPALVSSAAVDASALLISSPPSTSLRYFAASTLNATASDRPPECPPCFDCTKPRFGCLQYGQCNEYDGQCRCPEGFGGEDCSKPLCGSLADGSSRYARDGEDCECKEGWTGLNCNVCTSNKACASLVTPPDQSGEPYNPLSAIAAQGEEDEADNGAVCYTGGYAVNQIYQMCDVTNRKILDMLPDRKPQVTFMCDRPSASCNFQFWIGKIESFYCQFDNCTTTAELSADKNSTTYDCAKMKCSCIPGRMLCGEEGSINIDDFLAEEIKGPGKMVCDGDGHNCVFDEPAMNSLINDVFGDSAITLDCQSGECMHYSMVPGFTRPSAPDNSRLVALSIAAAGLVFFTASLLFWYLGRTSKHEYANGVIQLPEDDDNALTKSIPAQLTFTDLSYSINGRQVLSGVSGSLKPGEVMAIMGASGAGKSTLLDLLARKSKRGNVVANVRVNGKKLSDAQYKRLVGFVDQEDTLMGTLTVYETILYSALLRLPREMSFEAKRLRTLETMHELGILAIKDSRIGEAGKRSISGGEKRRVSIACELVTSPSILFLDEPTSGLDSFNAFNVVESLVNLARNYQRTVIFTIHQPRSNIVALFDHLLLLAGGRTVYSGHYSRCQGYFDSIGYPCPAGYNIADYLIDLTMQDEATPNSTTPTTPGLTDQNDDQRDTELQTHKRTSSKLTSWISSRSSPKSPASPPRISGQLRALVDAYSESEISRDLATQRDSLTNKADEDDVLDMRGYQRATWWTQFKILSGRAFKNLYRNPMLMLAHYAVSIVVAVICAFLFKDLTNDISGFQNRMGLFFFILALFGFSCLTSLGVFAGERILFMRERANGYYSPFIYFTAKILFDILPLRVVPPFILGAIIYKPVGLVPAVAQFWNLILVLILFNLVASSAVFLISIVVTDGGVANLTGSLVMLFNLLFAGLLINREKVPPSVSWLIDISFFHAAFEGLLVNEVRYLQLRDHKYGVDLEVPAATILSLFGFRAQAFWFPDIVTLLVMFAGLIVLSFVALVFFVKERR